jgi:hypothetical protein
MQPLFLYHHALKMRDNSFRTMAREPCSLRPYARQGTNTTARRKPRIGDSWSGS